MTEIGYRRTGPADGQNMEETAEKLKSLGVSILCAARDELYFSMRFLDVALSSFVYQMDSSVSPFGTDGAVMYFHPQQLGGLLRENRILVNRGYLHMVFHCIFRHMFKRTDDERYWDLSCDIAAEHLIDGCDKRPVRWSRSLLRRETYRKLEAGGRVMNAERIFRELKAWELTEKELSRLEEEFRTDDHRYWENRGPERKKEPELSRKWQEINEKMETDLETFSKEASEENGNFLGQLRVENRERQNYREFLRKFSVLREEMGTDPDTFDYGFYSYGLSLYGNMPLIEPLETREVRRIADFIIVIDTSMSCSGTLVRRFLEETYSVLKQNDSYFRRVNVHIIQCDEKVHSDVKITSEKELKKYMDQFELYGEGGTDFRPAFAYVDELLGRGEFDDLKGLIYFTDGYGIYPSRMPPYKTAFVFLEEDYRDADVPAWAIRLVLREDELESAGN
ncbi:MAG: VWA-like domain-containing protein [Mediterraneibacter sp.]